MNVSCEDILLLRSTFGMHTYIRGSMIIRDLFKIYSDMSDCSATKTVFQCYLEPVKYDFVVTAGFLTPPTAVFLLYPWSYYAVEISKTENEMKLHNKIFVSANELINLYGGPGLWAS